MSLLAEVDIEKHYLAMRGAIRTINHYWKSIPESDQLHCRELANDLVDTWQKLEDCYLTHDEDQFEFIMSLYLNIFNEYERYATWYAITGSKGSSF